jgi:hypothetical protein
MDPLEDVKYWYAPLNFSRIPRAPHDGYDSDFLDVNGLFQGIMIQLYHILYLLFRL